MKLIVIFSQVMKSCYGESIIGKHLLANKKAKLNWSMILKRNLSQRTLKSVYYMEIGIDKVV